MLPTAATMVPPTPPSSRTLAARPRPHVRHPAQNTEDEIPPLPKAQITSGDVHANGQDSTLGPSDASGSRSALDQNDDLMQALPEGLAEMEANVAHDGDVDFSQVAEWTTGEGYIYDDPDAESMCYAGAGSTRSCVWFRII